MTAEAIKAAGIIDPLENPRGFCELLRERLSWPAAGDDGDPAA